MQPHFIAHAWLFQLWTFKLADSPTVQYQASQHLTLSAKATKSSSRTTASANPASSPALHFWLLLLTWISTDSPSEVHPARRQLWRPHPFCYPPCAHIICFGLLGHTSMWRGREKLFKLHKHNVARAPLAAGDGWGPHTEEGARSFQELTVEQPKRSSSLFTFNWRGCCGPC